MGARRPIALLVAAVGWFALVLQLALMLTLESPISVGMRLVNFFSYFTILSNILVATVLTAVALNARTGWPSLLARPRVMAAAALYIGVTGLVYFLILRMIWDPEGLDYVADVLLHYVMPVVYLVFWIAFVPRGDLGPRDVPLLIAFPVVYAAYSLVRGPIVQWYPYPFLDLGQNSVSQVAMNMILLLVGFGLFAAMLVAFDRIVASFRSD